MHPSNRDHKDMQKGRCSNISSEGVCVVFLFKVGGEKGVGGVAGDQKKIIIKPNRGEWQDLP